MQYETRVFEAGDGFDFECACGFLSVGWPSKEVALDRGRTHTAEHEGGDPVELVDFREVVGLNGDRTNVVRFADRAKEEAK